MTRPLRAAAAALMLVLVVGLGVSTASASALAITAAPGLSISTAAACASPTVDGEDVIRASAAGTLNAGTYPHVEISEIPAGCQGLPLEAFVHDGAGEVLASGVGVTSREPMTVDVGTFTGAASANFVVNIDGWILPADWTVPLPDGPIACYLLDAAGDVQTNAQGIPVRCDNAPRLVSVNAWPGAVQVVWEATADSSVLVVFDLSDPVYAGYDGDPATSAVTLHGYNGTSELRDGDDCSAMPALEVMANHPNPAWGDQPLSGAVTVTSTPQQGAVCPN